MAIQDKGGTTYEMLLAYSLEALGYERNVESKKNYVQPSKNSAIAIPGTYIQPDLVVRECLDVVAVLYSTHWSNTRDSKRKFWRTWEEQAQQRVVLGDAFLAVNCVFEALPESRAPMLITTASDLPLDADRESRCPIQLEGWDPGIGWALVESFDVNILFPKGYRPTREVKGYDYGDQDRPTTTLLKKALSKIPKQHYSTQWACVRNLKHSAFQIPENHPDTRSRYRIGLLHIYLLVRLCELGSGNRLALDKLVKALAGIAGDEIELAALNKISPFDVFNFDGLEKLVIALAGVYVRKGKNPEGFCSLRVLTSGQKKLVKVEFNKDLQIAVADLLTHIDDKAFVAAIDMSFFEPPRVSRRLNSLRGLSHGHKKEANPLLGGVPGACGSVGRGAAEGRQVAVGCDAVDIAEARVYA